MTRYDDFWVKMPKRFQSALKKCGTDRFLANAGSGIVDEFHGSVRRYDGSSEAQFRHAYARSKAAMAPRLLAPFASMKPADAAYRDHMEFFRHHLDCLKASGLSDGEVVDAVAAQAFLVLQGRKAVP
jgi:hypothetical protein